MLRETLRRIIDEYPQALQERFTEHPVARLLREDAVAVVREVLGARSARLAVQGSSGTGRWADIPWITILDPRVTDTPRRGYYIVYLFNWRARSVVLSLNQGSTHVGEEFGTERDRVLAQRAQWMQSRVGDREDFTTAQISLDAATNLGRSYEPGHALGRTYDADALPPEHALQSDLLSMCDLYAELFARGGVDAPETEHESDELTQERPQATSVVERRVYRAHRRIERRPKNAVEVKRAHGHRCQACSVVMADTYGDVGEGYIEAHHLIPLAQLKEGIEVKMDVLRDFCVLCPNCHRMIHRQDDPSDLEGLKIRIATSSSN